MGCDRQTQCYLGRRDIKLWLFRVILFIRDASNYPIIVNYVELFLLF